MTFPEKIAFLGIGLMGLPMASNLLKSGFQLSVWNRSIEKAQDLEASGADLAISAADAVRDAGLIISMMSDGSIVDSLVQDADIREALTENAIWTDMSSTRPDEAIDIAKSLARINVGFADAPVSGGTKGAESAQLAIMVGASGDVFTKISPVLSALGRPVQVGPIGTGQLAKLANQMIVASTIAAVAEATLLLEEGGAQPSAVRKALKGGFADSVILQQHGERMSQRDFAPGGLSRLQLKDLDNILYKAKAHNLTLPVTEQVRDRFARYVSSLNGGESDHSGLFEELLDLNGLTS